jgi:hypothetical protein
MERDKMPMVGIEMKKDDCGNLIAGKAIEWRRNDVNQAGLAFARKEMGSDAE